MPMYEYECRDCGARFERLVFNSDEEISCKECESARVEQRLSVFAVVGNRSESTPFESGPCGACGAPERGLCSKN